MRLDQCEAAIREKKSEMIQLGMTKGLQNEETISCSQELDKLLNDYNRLLSDSNHSKPIDHNDDYFFMLSKLAYKLLSIPYKYFFI
jgi:hypothetical protein